MTEQQRRGLMQWGLRGTPKLVRTSGRSTRKKKDFNPREARNPRGEWTSGGAGVAHAAHSLSSAIGKLGPGEQVEGHRGGYVRRLKQRDVAGNEYEVRGRGFQASRHQTPTQAYEAAVRMGMRLAGEPRQSADERNLASGHTPAQDLPSWMFDENPHPSAAHQHQGHHHFGRTGRPGMLGFTSGQY
jgi:hypothetical protein